MRALYVLLLMRQVGPRQVFLGALLLFLAYKVFVTITYVPGRWEQTVAADAAFRQKHPPQRWGTVSNVPFPGPGQPSR